MSLQDEPVYWWLMTVQRVITIVRTILVLVDRPKTVSTVYNFVLKSLFEPLLYFCLDVTTMTLDAILAGFALVAVFLGLTLYSTISSLLFGQKSQLAPIPSFFSRLRVRVLLKFRGPPPIPAPVPPQTLTQRWIAHTWDVLHSKHFQVGGVSPLVLFLSILVPIVLACVLVRQHRQYNIVLADELEKRRLVDETLVKVRRTRDQQMQPMEAIRASLICALCNKGYTRPYILAPCGHTFDLPCLKRVFRNTTSNTPKTCPTCHTPVAAPPILSWIVKTVADAVAEKERESDDYPVPKGNVWKGVFDTPEVRTEMKGPSYTTRAMARVRVWWVNVRRQVRYLRGKPL
ncbi:hypothetical protein C8F04DRAFT_1399958 [Mycena alexandri]|uniref:RING-type domain-containing protein n=1 Tax=Mycena alexandri TaxID=1745969 RepID=A0AAD6SGK1_9AGAR|nr:hypothetical protein C8F04DRAFT_1399958 [Mycena alexandri]